MNKNSKKIQELTEAMRAERDIRIRNRMMVVLDVLVGHSTKTASDFADVDRRTVQLWVAWFSKGDIGSLWDASGRGRVSRARYGRIRTQESYMACISTIITPSILGIGSRAGGAYKNRGCGSIWKD